MNLVIDSDILIYFLKGQIEIVEKLSSYPAEALFTTRINCTELLYGAYNSSKIEYNLSKITALLSVLPIEDGTEVIRIISARRAEPKERKRYEQNCPL